MVFVDSMINVLIIKDVTLMNSIVLMASAPNLWLSVLLKVIALLEYLLDVLITHVRRNYGSVRLLIRISKL
jgi:hypothetical protein